MAKRIRRRIGDVVKIPLGTGYYGFGRILKEPLVAFYDLRVQAVPNIETIISARVLFKVWVMNHAVTSGRWEVIGNRPLEPDMIAEPVFFKQDPINNKFFKYYKSTAVAATRQECLGLERAAVWEPEHVEDRLRDYYEGVPNKWVESLKP
jgi:hypothetical protein